MQVNNLKGGVNWRVDSWKDALNERNQCVYLQNLRYKDEYVDSIPGTQKYHGTSLGSDPITGILPYYNDQNDNYKLLVAIGDKIVKRDEQLNEFTTLKSGLTKNSIFSSAIRHGVQYIPSEKDGLFKYLGGEQIETVGGGSTRPGAFRQILYMKEIDRMFGISDDAVYGQITWCNLGQPEIWDGANVERLKLKEGERVEGAEILYGKLVIFCTYTIWIYYVSGNEENWKLEEAPTNVGCIAPNTIKKIGTEIWFLGESPRYQRGVYAFNGSQSRLLTDDMNPFFDSMNKNKLRNACAEVHDDLYRISCAIGYSSTNDYTLELDISNNKEDGTPAMYGPHTYGFYSSGVLNTRQKNGELLFSDQSDGFVYYENGTTLKSTNGTDGSLLQHRFLSRTHYGEDFEIMKRYKSLSVFFRPRGNHSCRLRYYLTTGGRGIAHNFSPSAQSVGFAGDFNAYDLPLNGTPGMYEWQEFLGAKAIGTSIQIEIINDNIGDRFAFDGYGFDSIDLHKVRRVQKYAI